MNQITAPKTESEVLGVVLAQLTRCHGDFAIPLLDGLMESGARPLFFDPTLQPARLNGVQFTGLQSRWTNVSTLAAAGWVVHHDIWSIAIYIPLKDVTGHIEERRVEIVFRDSQESTEWHFANLYVDMRDWSLHEELIDPTLTRHCQSESVQETLPELKLDAWLSEFEPT
jgi:hypothetical protein